jgi:hypothetical protein
MAASGCPVRRRRQRVGSGEEARRHRTVGAQTCPRYGRAPRRSNRAPNGGRAGCCQAPAARHAEGKLWHPRHTLWTTLAAGPGGLLASCPPLSLDGLPRPSLAPLTRLDRLVPRPDPSPTQQVATGCARRFPQRRPPVVCRGRERGHSLPGLASTACGQLCGHRSCPTGPERPPALRRPSRRPSRRPVRSKEGPA